MCVYSYIHLLYTIRFTNVKSGQKSLFLIAGTIPVLDVNDVSSCSHSNGYNAEDNEYYLIMYLRKKREQRQMILMTPSPWEQIAKLAISEFEEIDRSNNKTITSA